MTKILIPLAVLAGLVLGLFFLLARRKITIPKNASRATLAILTAAAAVAGMLGATSCKCRPMTTCYKPAMPADTQATGTEEARVEKLEKLHGEGKIGDEAYQDALARIQEEGLLAAKEPTPEEMEAIEELRKMNTELVGKLAEEESWTVLEGQVGELEAALASTDIVPDYEGGFDPDRTTAAAGTLHVKGYIDEPTSRTIATVLNNVFHHHRRSTSGKTCYKMKQLSFLKKGWKGKLLLMFQSIADHDPSFEEYIDHLGLMATAVTCLSSGDESACSAEPSEGPDRVSMVRALDLLIALSR